MNISELLLKTNRLPQKQVSEIARGVERHLSRPDRHRLSEPRSKFNIVKINKSKLPLDFFPGKQSFSRRESSTKVNSPTQILHQLRFQNKIDSERKHYSPEKTSFFGGQEELESQAGRRGIAGNRFLNRKFQTRDEHKRDLFALQPTRKLNTAAKTTKHQIMELYPSTYDPQIFQLLAASSRTQNVRLGKRDISTKQRESAGVQDPETSVVMQPSGVLKQGLSQPVGQTISSANNLSMQEKSVQPMMITFYNAKSSCLPPINRNPRP